MIHSYGISLSLIFVAVHAGAQHQRSTSKTHSRHLDEKQHAAVLVSSSAGSAPSRLGKDVLNVEKVQQKVQQQQQSKVEDNASGSVVFIPDPFKTDSELVLAADAHLKPFPRFEVNSEGSNLNPMDTLLDFLNASIGAYSKVTDFRKVDARNQVLHTNDHQFDKFGNVPETLYVLSSDGVFVSESGHNISASFGTPISKKLDFTHGLMNRSFSMLLDTSDESVQNRWPRLRSLLFKEKISVPFFMWYGDYTGCNYNNWRGNQTLLLFTVAAKVDCQHAFPFPNYQTYKDSLESADDWKLRLKRVPETHPTWKGKIPQVVWRGGLTGKMPKHEALRGPRYHLTKFVHSLSLSQKQRDMFNVKLIYLCNKGILAYINTTELGWTGEDFTMAKFSFRKYRAVLDADGHSWSSRFGELLCFSSVVLKVEPEYVDYFHYKRNNDTTMALQPWKHYIPIKSDLSDLIEKTEYAISDDNAEHIEGIVKEANQWCRSNMIRDVVAHDALDVWESYVKTLDQYSPSWKEQWMQAQQTVMTGPMHMSLI